MNAQKSILRKILCTRAFASKTDAFFFGLVRNEKPHSYIPISSSILKMNLMPIAYNEQEVRPFEWWIGDARALHLKNVSRS